MLVTWVRFPVCACCLAAEVPTVQWSARKSVIFSDGTLHLVIFMPTSARHNVSMTHAYSLHEA